MGKYDMAVVGAEFGGLAAAALLGMKGRKSFVSTPCASLPDALGRIEREGFSFSLWPALSYGFEPGGELHRLFGDLNIDDMSFERAEGYQVALPDRRINVSARIESTLEEIRREFPRDIANAENFYRDVQKESRRGSENRVVAYLSRLRPARSFIAKYHFSREFLSFLDIQALFFFQKPAADLLMKDVLTLFTHRPFRSDDSFEKIAERIASTVVQRGGSIQYNEPSTEVVVHNNRAVGIQTASGTVEANTVLLDKSEQSKTVLLLGIHDQVVPVGMGRDVLYLPDYGQPENFLSLSLSAQEDSAAAPKGMRALTATFSASTIFPPPSQDMLIGSLAGLVPFLKDFLAVTIMPRPAVNRSDPDGISFTPLRYGKGKPLLFRGTKRNVYELRERHDALHNTMLSIRKLVKQVA